MASLILSIILIFVQLGNFKNEIKINAIVQEEKINILEDNFYIYDWQLRIPKINLIAQIKEGTTKEILDKFVGHFEDTENLNR